MQAGLPALFWRRPEGQTRLLSIGQTQTFVGSGAQAMARAQEWLEQVAWEQPPRAGLPRAWFASTFDQEPGQDKWLGWPGFQLVLPQLVISERADQSECLVQGLSEADLEHGRELLTDLLQGSGRASKLGVSVSDECSWAESPSAFAARVAATTQVLGDDLHKVVLANCRHHHYATSPLDSVLENLLTNPRDGIHFAYTHGNDAVLAGCTPETLVRQKGTKLSAHVLAGTRRIGVEGAAQDLLNSAKDRREHDLVATGMLESLDPLVRSLSIPEEPKVRSLTHLHHLERHLEGETHSGTGFLDLVSALHPTPALGGYPQASALEFLRQSEGLERGGFGAPFGWISGPRHGHAAVAIRSALLRGDAASVFAGAGVVAQSDPHLERAEIDAKILSIETELLGLNS